MRRMLALSIPVWMFWILCPGKDSHRRCLSAVCCCRSERWPTLSCFFSVFSCAVDCGCVSGALTPVFSPLQAPSAEKSSAGASGSRAKMVECVRARTEGSDAFAPSRATTGASTGGRRARLHFQAATASSVRTEGFAGRCSSVTGTLTPAAASLASQVPAARPPPASPSSPEDTCPWRRSVAARRLRST